MLRTFLVVPVMIRTLHASVSWWRERWWLLVLRRFYYCSNYVWEEVTSFNITRFSSISRELLEWIYLLEGLGCTCVRCSTDDKVDKGLRRVVGCLQQGGLKYFGMQRYYSIKVSVKMVRTNSAILLLEKRWCGRGIVSIWIICIVLARYAVKFAICSFWDVCNKSLRTWGGLGEKDVVFVDTKLSKTWKSESWSARRETARGTGGNTKYAQNSWIVYNISYSRRKEYA